MLSFPPGSEREQEVPCTEAGCSAGHWANTECVLAVMLLGGPKSAPRSGRGERFFLGKVTGRGGCRLADSVVYSGMRDIGRENTLFVVVEEALVRSRGGSTQAKRWSRSNSDGQL